MNHTHPPLHISDYVLDLLPLAEKKRFEQHAATCADCLAAIQKEREVGTAVREAIQQSAIPSAARLQALMPTPPTPKSKQPWRAALPTQSLRQRAWARPMAAMAVLLMLFLANFSLNNGSYDMWQSNAVATSLAATATSLPTSTSTAVVVNETPEAQPSPPPVATPIAQITPDLKPIPLTSKRPQPTTNH